MKLTYDLPSSAQGKRLRDALNGVFPQLLSAKSVRNAISNGLILLNGHKVNSHYIVEIGDVATFFPPEQSIPMLRLDIPVLYEDDHLAVINKPSGIAVSGNQGKTVVRALPYNLQPNAEGQLPHAVHRLDGPTSGVLLIAKEMKTRIALGKMLADRHIDKTYYALVNGETPSSGRLSTPLDEKPAETTFRRKALYRHPKILLFSLLHLTLLTGRTHQIRRHLAGIGHPVIGDLLYGEKEQFYRSLFLHAQAISFTHPINQQRITVTAPLPQRFDRLIQRAEKI